MDGLFFAGLDRIPTPWLPTSTIPPRCARSSAATTRHSAGSRSGNAANRVAGSHAPPPALQPLGTTLFLHRLARATNWGEAPAFAPGQLVRLRALEANFRTDFGLEFGRPAIAFRVGHAPEIANASLRRRLAVHS